jgi:autotransporter-associated beta strand protein
MIRHPLRVQRLELRLTPALATWDGGGADNHWTAAANWVGDVAPQAGDDLVFPTGVGQLTNVNDFAAGTAFNSIVVGLGYTLGGNTVTLANGLSSGTDSGSATVNLGVTLAAAQSFTTPTNFDLIVGGAVNLNGFALTVAGNGRLDLNGPVSGAGGIVKINTDTLSLAGNNTYTGITDIRAGILEVRSDNALGAAGSGNETELASARMTLLGGPLAIAEGFSLGATGYPPLDIVALNSGPAAFSGPLHVVGTTDITGQGSNPLVIGGSLTGSAALGLNNVVVAATSVSPTFTGEMSGRVEFDGQAPGAPADAGFAANIWSGTGTLGLVSAFNGGSVTPGVNGVGTLHTGGLSIAPGGGIHIFIPPGRFAINVGPTGAGQAAVTGSVSLGGVLDLTITPEFVPAAGSRYRIIDNDGTDPVTNVFSGLAEGAVAAMASNVALRITYHGGDGNDVELVAGAAPFSNQRFAVAAGAGGFPIVNVYDDQGALIRSFFAYDPSFRGGVNVATAEFTHDGVPEIITAPGFGGGPVVRIWDGQTGAMLREFNAYDPAFRGGVNISTGLENSDATPDIVTGAGRGGGPHVKAFDANGNLLVSFFAYDPSFTGGVSVAGGDGVIVTGAGPGGGPHVKVFDVQNFGLRFGFFAYDPSFTGGINVGYNSTTGIILAAPKAGGGPLVRGFFSAGELAFQFLAYGASFTGGVNLAVLPIGPGGANVIVTGPGLGGGPHVRVWSQNGATIQREFLAFDPAFTGGIYVG